MDVETKTPDWDKSVTYLVSTNKRFMKAFGISKDGLLEILSLEIKGGCGQCGGEIPQGRDSAFCSTGCQDTYWVERGVKSRTSLEEKIERAKNMGKKTAAKVETEDTVRAPGKEYTAVFNGKL